MLKSTLLVLFLLRCLTASAAADLRLTNLKATYHPDGRTVDLQLEWQNHGPADAENVACNVNVFAGEQRIVSQTFSLDPMPVGQSRTDILPVTFPGDRANRIQAEIYDSKEADTQPSSNFLQINIQPPGLKKVDLNISEASVKAPDNPRHKASMLHVLLQNDGPEKAPGTTLQVELEAFSEVIASSEKRIRPLDPDAVYELKIPIPEPPVMAYSEGTVRIKWLLSDPKFTDVDEQNNSYQLVVPLQIRMPDLIAEDIEIRKGKISFLVRNQGNVRAGESITALYVNNALAMRYKTAEIPPGRSRSFKYSDLPVTEDAKVAVVADFNAEVEEYSEENNRTQYRYKSDEENQ